MTGITVPSIQMKTQQRGCCVFGERNMYHIQDFSFKNALETGFFGGLQKRHRSMVVSAVLGAKFISAWKAEATSMNLLALRSNSSELATLTDFSEISLYSMKAFFLEICSSTSRSGRKRIPLIFGWILDVMWNASRLWPLFSSVFSLSPDLWSPV